MEYFNVATIKLFVQDGDDFVTTKSIKYLSVKTRE